MGRKHLLRSLVAVAVFIITFFLIGFIPGSHEIQAAGGPNIYTVKKDGTGDFTTIQACADVAVAGDTCVIYAGTYNEQVTPIDSGSAGNPITYSTNPGDAVTVTGWNLGTLSYITIRGSATAPMIITQSITWSAITHSIFQYISNTGGAGGGSCFGGNGWYTSGQPSSYNQFLNLTLKYCGGMTNNSSGAIELEGDHNLFDTLNVSYSQAAITLSGQFNVIRNSTFGPTSLAVIGSNHSQPVENSVACGGSSSDIPGGMQHLLYENNYSAQWRGGNSHGVALVTDTGSTPCGTTSNVFRLSQTMDSGSYSTEIYSSLNSYFYNDSFSNTQLDAGTKDKEDYQYDPNSPNSRTINDIFANMTQVGSEDWCIYADTPLVENHNLCFNTGWSGSWYGPTTGSGNTYDASDIFNKDPLFVNADTNLQLQSGSPAIGAGGPLTTAVGSGASSESLTVADAGFFSWGYGIPNVQPDWIRIGASTEVQISSINYSTNVITLASPVSWNDGDPIYLYKDSNGNVVLTGAAPNIGAYQSLNSSTPPSTKFSIGEGVQVASGPLSVRSTASTSGTLLGTQPTGALGSITAGPVTAGGFNWWDVSYDSGVSGWSIEDYLTNAPLPTSPPPSSPTPPSIPTNLSATAVSPSQINLTWTASTDSVGVAGYEVFRNGAQVGTTTTTSYVDSSLLPSVLYSYTVSAFDAAGNVSAQSGSVSATTQQQSTPSGCLIANSTWQDQSFASQTGLFTLQFDATPQGSSIDAVTGLSASPAAAYTDMAAIIRFNMTNTIDAMNSSTYQAVTSLAYVPNTTYHVVMTVNMSQRTYSATVTPQGGATTTIATNYLFRNTQASITNLSYLNAFDDIGSHTICNVVANSVSTTPPPTTPRPSISSVLSANATSGSTFSYQIMASNNPTSYSASGLPAGLSVNTNTGFISGTPITAGTFNVTIGALNSGGTGIATLVFTVASVSDVIPPSTPTGLVVTGTTTSTVSLFWVASTDNVGVAGYKIYRNGSQIGTSTASSYTDTGLAAGTSYSYAVSAYDAAGNDSSLSQAVSATTLSAPDTIPPTATITGPANNAAVSGIKDISVSASDNVGVTKVELYVDGTLQSSLTSPPYIFSLNTASLANGSHTLSAKAYDAAGNVGTSPTVTVTTNNAPQVITVSLASVPASSGIAPVSISLTATVGGTAVGTLNYTFYCNRGDAGTNVTSPADLTVSAATSSSYVASNVCTYQTPGTYTAKVIVEQGLAPAAQAQQVITVNAAPVSSGGSGSSSGGGGGGGGGGSVYVPPSIVTNVTVAQITDTSAQVAITLSQAASVLVQYGITTNYGQATIASPELTTAYENLTGLSPSTVYDFRVVAIPQGSASPVASGNYLFVTQGTGTGGGSAGTNGSSSSSSVVGSSQGTNSPPPFPKNLYSGDTGSDVTLLQTTLKSLGYFPPDITPTGYFGPATQHALLLFQRDHQLNRSGFLDMQTQALLSKVVEANPSLVGGGLANGAAAGTQASIPATASSSSASSVFTKYLYRGLAGDDQVSMLQRLLNADGDYPQGIVSGFFGPLTQEAVTAFQVKHAIFPATGNVGPLTRAELNDLAPQYGIGVSATSSTGTASPSASSATFSFTRYLVFGMSGSDVAILQGVLTKDGDYTGPVTGYFGPLTQAAVREFQAKYGIVSSGTPSTTGYGAVGPKTRGKLEGM